MAAPDKNKPTIVIKRIKKGGHGHHGGAWKIAYADFVTAMMAFFLLMWLLGSTTQGDLKGIADYFNNPMKVSMAGGSGSGDAVSVLQGGGTDLARTHGQVKEGERRGKKKSASLREAELELARMESERMKQLMARVGGVIDGDAKLRAYRNQIRLELIKDGLRIQIVDDQNRPMFDTGKAVVKDYLRDLLREIGRVLNEVTNKVTLSGHTDASPYQNGERGYSNWELSADRANASRRELVAGGMADDKIFRVVGLASSVPFNPDNPLDPTNRRITLIVMNRDAEQRLMKGGGQIEASDADEVLEGAKTVSAEPTAPAPAAPSVSPAKTSSH